MVSHIPEWCSLWRVDQTQTVSTFNATSMPGKILKKVNLSYGEQRGNFTKSLLNI